uniref:Ribonuclease H n=1 Tax=Medicago truncatula TaxID=3880 RepID=Q2HRS8_MEDTR|nr:Ribonuclease H [Medicago truncatula]
MGPQCFLFAACLWWAWRHRNNMCLSNETWSTHHLSFNIQSMVENFKVCFKPTSNDTLDIRFIKWNNNNFSSVILNVDGYIHNSSYILQAELLDIYQDLMLAKSMNIDELVCYFDSLHGINLIKGPPMKYHVHDVLIQDIKDLVEENNIIVRHTLQKGNQFADFMAKFGALSNVDFLIHPSPPIDIMSLLKNDATGTFLPRN